jgi:hypothetical protein
MFRPASLIAGVADEGWRANSTLSAFPYGGGTNSRHSNTSVTTRYRDWGANVHLTRKEQK